MNRRVLFLVTGTAALLAMSFTLRFTAANVLMHQDELELALSVRGETAQALALLALRQSQADAATSAKSAVPLARRALAKSPMSWEAATALGIQAATRDQTTAAMRSFAYSDFLTRRDITAQLWLLEQDVDRNDIPGALQHYDRVLRYTVKLREGLTSVLAQAASDMAVARPLSRMLNPRPPYWVELYSHLLGSYTDPGTFLLLMQALQFDARLPSEQTFISGALFRMIEKGDVASAFRWYSQFRPERSTSLLRDGNFDQPAHFGPFGWTLTDRPSLAGRLLSSGGGQMLSLISRDGIEGEVAKQMLVLSPGNYQIRFRIGDVGGDEITHPRIIIRCLEGAEAVHRIFPTAPTDGLTVTASFTIPGQRACSAQWLSIVAREPEGDVQVTPWIDDISITRR